MTALQTYLLVAPVILVVLGGGLALYARRDADRSRRNRLAVRHPAVSP